MKATLTSIAARMLRTRAERNSVPMSPAVAWAIRWIGSCAEASASKGCLTLSRLLQPLGIELAARLLNALAVAERPAAQSLHRRQQRAPQIGQLVVDPRRNAGRHGARDETVALQRTQSKGQHALRDAANLAL